jgi:glycine oxidase
VIGGGVMGCATALALASRGAKEVVVLERAVPGAEASSAAAGMLGAQIESKDDDELGRYVRARDAYGAWAAELRERSGVDVGYKKTGALSLARTDERLESLAASVSRQRARGLAAEILDPRGARAVERELGDGITGAAYFPDEAQVDPPQLLRALVAATGRAGVVVRSGATVSALVSEAGRCTGVALDAHDVLGADAVVLAAGSWSSLVPGVPERVPRVRPIRGQLVQLEERPPRLSTIVIADAAYVLPRGDGRVICGSTMEDVGHRREVTASGVHAILGGALAIAPCLGGAELVRSWCNFRPQAASGAPLVGASPLPGLFLATGHHRNGILLARETAVAVADAVLSS